jgi:hypothetical protein
MWKACNRRVRAAVILASLLPLSAQEFRATLTGRALDPHDAPIAAALVTIKNAGTNASQQTHTDAQGNYSAVFLQPGDYVVIVEAAGFKKTVREGISLTIGQAATLDLRLELGAVTQEVTVTAAAPLLDHGNAERGGLIDEESVKEFPLNGRNPFMLSMLTPGVDFNGNLTYQRPFDNGAIADWNIGGGGNRNAEFLIDGAPNNAQAGGNNIAYVPPVDSVQEFKIQVNSYDAQYGRSGGGTVNVALKSGANRVHGSVYEFARRNELDANSFQNNARGAPRDGHYLDQYGVLLDGPVYFPKIYDGRNKTFFLFNYEGYREGSPQPLILSVPTADMRNGDFSKLVDASQKLITIYDPTTGRTVNGAWTRDPFPGNVIPQDRINPISRKIAGYFPLPNTSTPGQSYAQQNFFFSGDASSAIDHFYNLVFKFDQNIGSRHRISFRDASNDRTEIRPTNGIAHGPGADGQLPLKRINDTYVIDWVATVSPSMIFNLRSSFSRYVEGSRADADANFDITSLGFPASLSAQLPYGAYFGRYTLDGYVPLGRYPSQNITNSFNIHPTITKVTGARTTKAGLDMRWIQYSTQNPGNVFTLASSTVFTQHDYTRADGVSGDSLAGFLLGTPTSGSVNYAVFPIFMYRYFAPWVQQDWKVLPRLTLNFGLRVDLNYPPNERFNRMNRGFDTKVLSPVDALIDRSKFPGYPTLYGGLLFAGQNGEPRTAANLDWKTFQPRFGMAYSLTSKIVVRGGWGRYYINPNNDFQQTYGFSNSTGFSSSNDGNRSGIPNSIDNPFPTVLTPHGSADGLLTFVGRGFNFVNSKFRIPYNDQFSFSIQRAIGARAKFEIAYAGSRGHDLQTTENFNEVGDASFRDRCNFALGGNPSYCDQGLPNPFKGLAPFFGTNFYTSNTESRAQLLRPFPQFGAFTEYMLNTAASWYNSLQTVFTARTRNGVNLNVNYTFSKNMGRNGYLDVPNNIMQQGLYQWDKPHRFVASAIWQLPIGRGKRWLSGAHGFVGSMVSGWENTVIFQISSGGPWSLPTNVMYLKNASLPVHWGHEKIQAVAPCVDRWNSNNTITVQPFSGAYGCTDPNFLLMPTYNPRYTDYYDGHVRLQTVQMADVSLNKMTRINERFNVQFRAEAFNIANSFFINQQQFNNNADNANFGYLLKSAVSAPNSNYPRQVQLAVKLLW